MKNLIALCGPIESGKTTLANLILAQKPYARISFAEPIRRMVADLITYQGIPWQKSWIWVTDPKEKEAPCPQLEGRTPREAMQTLGTEWGRNLVHTDFWIEVWARKVARYDFIVVDDLRFPNEAAKIKALGGTLIAVNRAGYGYHSSHSSEQQIGTIVPDFEVANDRTPQDLYEKIAHLL